MNVHIYKGDVGKSSIMSHMMHYMEFIGVILYSKDRPYPNINGAFMAPREHVTPEDLASYISNLLEDGGDWGRTVIVYTNYT